MSGTKPDDEKDQVINQFSKKCRCKHSFYESCCNSDYATMRSLAGEIVRQRQRAVRAERILAALSAPSEAIVDAVMEAAYDDSCHVISAFPAKYMICVAVAAAEREVDG